MFDLFSKLNLKIYKKSIYTFTSNASLLCNYFLYILSALCVSINVLGGIFSFLCIMLSVRVIVYS